MSVISSERIASIEAKKHELADAMARGDLAPDEFVRLSKEYAQIEPVAAAAREVRRLRAELEVLNGRAERDVIYCLRDHGPDALDWPVSRVMSSPAITIDSSTDVLAALALMTQRRIRHLPVVDNGEIRGLVSIGDLVKHRMERIEAEADAMREYIQSA